MCFNDSCSCSDLPFVTSDLGHASWQGASVNPVELSLTQPSQLLTQSYRLPHNVAPTGYGFVGYPAVGHTSQGAPWYIPTACLSPSPVHASGQLSSINHLPAGHPAGAPTPVGPMSPGLLICRWISKDGLICNQVIAERTVPEHLVGHGIYHMNRDRVVQCCWDRCGRQIKRQSITRHCREVHLGLKRRSHQHPFR